MLEVAKIKISNNLQGVFNLTLEGEYASYFQVQGTTLFMIKPIEDIGTYAVTVVVEDPLGRFETLRADYVFNIGCCPIVTRTTTTTPAPSSAPTAPAPLPTEDAPVEDLSTARILGIMEGLPNVTRYGMVNPTFAHQQYYLNRNYKTTQNTIWGYLRNLDSIFTYPDGTTFIREGRINNYVSPDGIMHTLTSPLSVTSLARESFRGSQYKNIKFDYPGLFDGMRFTVHPNFLQYRIYNPDDRQQIINNSTSYNNFTGGFMQSVSYNQFWQYGYASIQDFNNIISNFVQEILSPSDVSLISANETGLSRPELFSSLFTEGRMGSGLQGSLYGSVVQNNTRNRKNQLRALLSRVYYVTDEVEEQRWATWSQRYPSQKTYINRSKDIDRILEYYGILHGLENLNITPGYRDAYLYDQTDNRFDIISGGGFSIRNYEEKFHIVAVLYEIPKSLYDRETRSQTHSIFPQLIVHKQQYNASTGGTKTVNPNANFSGNGVSTQVFIPIMDDGVIYVHDAGSPFNEIVSPGNVALVAHYRIDDDLARRGLSNFFPNTVGPVRDRPQEEQNLVLEARLFNGSSHSASRFINNGVLDTRFAESFAYSFFLCGATGYNRVDSVTAPTPTTTTEPPVVDDVEEVPEVPEEEIEVFKMGNLNIEN